MIYTGKLYKRSQVKEMTMSKICNSSVGDQKRMQNTVRKASWKVDT
jgi:hypothetical protein